MSDEVENTEELEEPEKMSAFDRFVHDFSAENLESRVRYIFVFVMILMVITVGGGAWMLSQTFQIDIKGKLNITTDQTTQITLDQKYQKLVTEEMQLFLKGKEVKFEILGIQAKEGKIEVSLSLKGSTTNAQATPYQLYLVKKRYWDMFMDKAK